MDEFQFFSPIVSFKKGKDHNPEQGTVDMKISGIISDEGVDEEGERLIQKSIDFETYLMKSGKGRIKRGHTKDPKFFIGFPEKVIREGGKTRMEARIFAKAGTPQYSEAVKTVGDIENIVAYNEAHPGNPRSLGFSIEGHKQVDANGKFQKGIVRHVVIDESPVNPTSCLELAKSFSENSKTISKQKSQESFNMFNTKQEVKFFYLGKGFTEDEANAKVADWETKNADKIKTAEMFKSFGEAIDKQCTNLDKEIAALASGTSIEILEKGFSDTLKPVPGTDTVNPIPFMAELGKVTLELRKSLSTREEVILKAFKDQAETAKRVADINQALLERVDNLQFYNEQLLETNKSFEKALQTFQSGTAQTGLTDLKTEDENFDPKDFKTADEIKQHYLAKGYVESVAAAKAGEWTNMTAGRDGAAKNEEFTGAQVRTALMKAIDENDDTTGALQKQMIACASTGYGFNNLSAVAKDAVRKHAVKA